MKPVRPSSGFSWKSDGGKPAAREDGYADMPGIPGAVTETTGVVSEALDVRTIDC